MRNTQVLLGALALVTTTACKSRFFSFGPEPTVSPTAAASVTDPRSGQLAIGNQGSDTATGQKQQLPNQPAATYKPLQNSSQKVIGLGKTAQYDVNGVRVDVTFLNILEDSRCPRDVVCVWEGQARLQFTVSIPSQNLKKTIEASLRAGHPELGQVIVGSVGIDLIGLLPDTTANSTGGQRPSPEATVVVGRAP